MQVYKTKKGIQYREKICVDGKEIYSPRFARKTDAKEWKARMTSERARYKSSGVLPHALNTVAIPTFKEYSMMWLETRVKPQLATRTYEHYEGSLRNHLIPLFGEVKLNDLRLHHADKLIQTLSAKDHNAKGINLIMGVFKRVLIEASRENRLERNPLQYMKELKEAATPDIYLSPEEIDSILEASKGHTFHSLFLVAVNTGMRRGELAGLCWDRVNFALNLIEVSRIRDRNGLADRTKTFKSRRFIPMNVIVRRHLLEVKANRLSADLVFNEFDVNHLYRDFRKFMGLGNVKTLYRFHDIRHSFASHFMMNGGNIYDLQKILGHSNLEMTQRYAHLAPEHLVQVANIVRFGEKHLSEEQKLSLAVI